MAQSARARSRANSSSSRTSRRSSWTTVGALVASATLGSRFAVPAAANDLGGSALAGADSRASAVVRIEAALGPWERPEDVFAALYGRRPGMPGAPAGADRWASPQAQAPATQTAPPVRIDIAAGPLGPALRRFETLTGVRVQVPDDLLRDQTTQGASGLLTPEQALEALLRNTHLAFRFTSPSAALLEVRVNQDSVEVSASVPTVASAKFTAPLLDTPQTITVVPKAVIEAQGATTLRDILRNVPGITMQAGEGGGGLPGDSLTLRGFSASSDIFIDGVRDVGPYSRDSFNLEQVDVIKGPSSTFGGRGSTGGAINLETKTPNLSKTQSGSLGAGSAAFRRGTLDLNQPLPALGKSAAGRVNALWQDAGVPGRAVVENTSWAVAPSLAWGIGTRTRLTLGYQHLQQNNVPDYGLPWGTYTDPATGQVYPTGAFNATPAVDQSNFYGLEGYDFEHVRNDVGTVRAEHDFTRGGLSLRNITRYGDTLRDHAITAPRPPNRQLQRRWMDTDTFANQTSLSARVATGALTHELSAGVEAAREGTDTRNSAQTANQPQITLQSPDPTQSPFGPMPEITGNPSQARTGTLGAYLFDTVSLSPAWQATGGLRWDRSNVQYQLTTLATGVVTDLARIDRMTSWRAGVVFKPRPSASIYAGAGTSFNPASDAGTTGTALSATDTSVNSVNLKPEKSRNVEVGGKWAAFRERLVLTAAIFRTDKTNARTRNLTNEPFVLAGKQRVQGVEIGASGQIRRGLNALASFSYLDSDIVDSANATEEGRDLALTPKRTASLWATWEIRRDVTVGGGAQYMDAVFRNTTTDLAVPSYWLVNAMASYAINSHLTLRVNGTNLTDERYVDRVGGGHYIPGPRRAVQITTGLGF